MLLIEILLNGVDNLDFLSPGKKKILKMIFADFTMHKNSSVFLSAQVTDLGLFMFESVK